MSTPSLKSVFTLDTAMLMPQRTRLLEVSRKSIERRPWVTRGTLSGYVDLSSRPSTKTMSRLATLVRRIFMVRGRPGVDFSQAYQGTAVELL